MEACNAWRDGARSRDFEREKFEENLKISEISSEKSTKQVIS